MKKLGFIFIFVLSSGALFAGPIFDCNKCQGSGRVNITRKIRCTNCYGRKLICHSCKGRGGYVVSGGTGPYRMPDIRKTCLACYGSGTVSCSTCYGSGSEILTGTDTCPQCKGRGKFSL